MRWQLFFSFPSVAVLFLGLKEGDDGDGDEREIGSSPVQSSRLCKEKQN